MQKLLIKGKKELNGTIPISGSKNATLPILAASILTNKVILTNVPMVKDIFTMLELLKFIGLKIKVLNKKKIIEIKNINSNINTLAPYKLVKTMRAGVLVLGPLLTKYKKAKVSLPGGCAIGTRPVNLHLFALKKLGAKIKIKDGYIIAEAKKGLVGRKIRLPSIFFANMIVDLLLFLFVSGIILSTFSFLLNILDGAFFFVENKSIGFLIGGFSFGLMKEFLLN